MANENKRIFKKGEKVYVLHNDITPEGYRAIVTDAIIVFVDMETKQFLAEVADEGIWYSTIDYGRLVFDTLKDANKAVDNIPKTQTIVYVIINGRVHQRRVTAILDENVNCTQELVIEFNRGEPISIREIGKSIFKSSKDARAKLLKKV